MDQFDAVTRLAFEKQLEPHVHPIDMPIVISKIEEIVLIPLDKQEVMMLNNLSIYFRFDKSTDRASAFRWKVQVLAPIHSVKKPFIGVEYDMNAKSR